MSSQPFNAQAAAIRLSITNSASTAVQLPALGNQVRIVNHGSDAYLSIADTQGAAVATVPGVSAARTCTPVLGGSDITLTIPSDSAKWISGILDSGVAGTTYIDVMVGEGL